MDRSIARLTKKIEKLRVDLSVYNIKGECIQTIVDAYQTSGTYSVLWNGRRKDAIAPSGVYFARLHTLGIKGEQIQTQRMILLK